MKPLHLPRPYLAVRGSALLAPSQGESSSHRLRRPTSRLKLATDSGDRAIWLAARAAKRGKGTPVWGARLADGLLARKGWLSGARFRRPPGDATAYPSRGREGPCEDLAEAVRCGQSREKRARHDPGRGKHARTGAHTAMHADDPRSDGRDLFFERCAGPRVGAPSRSSGPAGSPCKRCREGRHGLTKGAMDRWLAEIRRR